MRSANLGMTTQKKGRKGFDPNDSIGGGISTLSTKPSTTANPSTVLGGSRFMQYREEHLTRMTREIEATTRKLEPERRRLNTIMEALKRARQELEDKRLGISRRDLAKEKEEKEVEQDRFAALAKPRGVEGDPQARTSAKQLKLLALKLEKSITRLNHATDEGKTYKDEIDKLRKERATLDTVYKKLTKEIAQVTENMKKLQQDMWTESEGLESARIGVEAFKKQQKSHRKEFEQNVEKWTEEKKVEAQTKRECDRLVSQMHTPAGQKHYMVADEEFDFSPNLMFRRILKLAFLNCIQRRHIKQHQKNIEVFQQAFDTILSSTGIGDIEEIVKTFVKLEEQNYSLLTYVNQLNRDIEAIELRNKELENQMKRQKDIEEDASSRKKAALQGLEQQIEKTKSAAEEKMIQVHQNMEVLNESAPYIKQCADYIIQTLALPKAECDLPDVEDDLLAYLTFVERIVKQYRDFLPPGAPVIQMRPPPHKKAGQQAMVNARELPAAENIAESDEDDEQPMSDRPLKRDELKERVVAWLQSKKRSRPAKIQTETAADGQRQRMTSYPTETAESDKMGSGVDRASWDQTYQTMTKTGEDGDKTESITVKFSGGDDAVPSTPSRKELTWRDGR
mmetsp:Transcript_39978/g.104859  ORF Transcript_39978/g.104859 Transcript_39978/m.104859 type:complete len:623 (+) Transcript_39978:64-1932(+)